MNTTPKIADMSIERIDYKSPVLGLTGIVSGYKSLSNLSSLDELSDLNEVKAVSIYFDTLEDAQMFADRFPKSMKVKAYLQGYHPTFPDNVRPCVYCRFNTFWTDKTTGSVNETAVKNRNRFFKELKEVLTSK
jgi:hypothetical protein